MGKLKYEKPASFDASSIQQVLGAECTNGSGAMDGCTNGNNPNLAPVCSPSGNVADYNCGTGNTNLLGNCRDHGLSAAGCYTGDSP